MRSNLINRLVMTNRVIFTLSLLLLIYLAVAAPETAVVSDKQAQLTQINSISSLAELKAEASGLAMVAHNAGVTSMVLLRIVLVTLLVFMLLSFASLLWLRRLSRVGAPPNTALEPTGTAP